jgi:uridylate kinase
MPENAALKYKRVLLKISGEALMGEQEFGIDIKACQDLASELKSALALGVEMCLVIGGGNIFRGMNGAAHGMERAQADNLGMLATVMNALAMQNALENVGIPTRVQSAIQMSQICEPFIRRRAMRHMEKGRVVIFAAGTGNPFFTTDTGAALRAAEMNCNAMLKGTQVDGVYTADPKLDESATRYDHLDYMDVLSQELRVMDATAISLMKERKIPIVVFSIHEKGSLAEVLLGRGVSTLIDAKGRA